MSMTNEQIQELKAAAEKATPGEWGIQFGDEIYASDGVNHEQIAMLFSDNSARDAEFIAAANPTAIRSLLAERDADKALIAESVVLFETLRQRIAELEREKDAMTAAALAMRDDMREARTLTIKLPPSAPENLASVLDGYEKWLCATTFRDTLNACLAEVKRFNDDNFNHESPTLKVKLPEPLMPAQHNSGELFMTPDNVEQGGYLNRDDVLRILRKACAAAGITLVVGE